jgi:hypothetical protein
MRTTKVEQYLAGLFRSGTPPTPICDETPEEGTVDPLPTIRS